MTPEVSTSTSVTGNISRNEKGFPLLEFLDGRPVRTKLTTKKVFHCSINSKS